MVRRWGKKLVEGAKEELSKEPIQLLNTEKVLEWVEIALPLTFLVMGIFRGFRKPTPPTTIVINNYIPGMKK